MIKSSKVDYFVLNETLVDPEDARAHHKIISENVVNTSGGSKLSTITYNIVLQSFGDRNWNGRTYSKDIVMKALDTNPILQHDLKMGTWAAEYGHPIIQKGTNELARQMTIFPPNMCNTINKYWVEGNLLMGECTTLAGGYGDMVRDRLLTGFPPMASSRAIGGVDARGNVLPGYNVVTFDTVDRPSHKQAYMVPGTAASKVFSSVTAPSGNSMTESCMIMDESANGSIRDFLLSESVSREQIDIMCEAFKIDYSSMEIIGNKLHVTRMDESSVQTIIMPLNKLIGAEYHNLFL